MLVQSHEGLIRLLPALPPSWSAGALEGVRLRGGWRVSFRWEDGRVAEGTISARTVGTVRVLVNGGESVMTLQAGEQRPLPV